MMTARGSSAVARFALVALSSHFGLAWFEQIENHVKWSGCWTGNNVSEHLDS